MKQQTKQKSLQLEGALALCLTTTPAATEIGVNYSHILKELRAALSDSLLTLSRIREVLLRWVAVGWVKLTGNYVALTNVGSAEISTLAAAA